MAAFYALAGLWLERRRQRRLPWSALVAAVPVLTLAVTYVQVGLFQPVTMWAFAALALTGGLTAAAWAAGADRQRAGVHAAGAVAALALGCAMLLSDQWLTLAIALLYLARRTGRVVQGWAWRLLGVVALFSAVLLLLGNPLVTNDPAGQTALLCGYLLPALLAGLASQAPELGKQNWAKLLGGYAVLAGFLWVGLEIRLLYHPGALGLDAAPIDEGELWAWSGGWLVYGGALMALGMATGQRAIRLAALAIIGLVTAKAFLIDMAGLEGLWRVLSFLGLGLMLIGIGGAYRRFVGQKEK
jgi:uncharacterized membrane protein